MHQYIFVVLPSMNKDEYSGMTVQVGNPSFLYEEMLDGDYEDTATNPDFSWSQEDKVNVEIGFLSVHCGGQ